MYACKDGPGMCSQITDITSVLACVVGVAKNLREGNETGRECEK